MSPGEISIVPLAHSHEIRRSPGWREEAIKEWKAALRLDPENFVIRKQIWVALYPEKFHPTIDFEWQKGQLERERQEEVAAGICGPDGCPLPQKHNRR